MALPYLDRGLSPSLFELSALDKRPVRRAAAGTGGFHRQPPGHSRRDDHPVGGRPRVWLPDRGLGPGVRWRAVAPVHRRSRPRLLRHGRLVPSRPDHRAGRGTASFRHPRPGGFPMHTVTVRGTGPNFWPAGHRRHDLRHQRDFTRSVPQLQRDDQHLLPRQRQVFSLPVARYWATEATFITPAPRQYAALRLVVLPQFTVTGNPLPRGAPRAPGQRRARSTMATPRRSVVQLHRTSLLTGGLVFLAQRAQPGGPYQLVRLHRLGEPHRPQAQVRPAAHLYLGLAELPGRRQPRVRLQP